MEAVIIYLIMSAMMVYALYLTFRGRNSGVVGPTLGFLNVGGEGLTALVEEDREFL
ncbi:MAG: hypothetical protein ACREQ2_14445 [Candidatus Binatia bacterium]